MFHIILHNVAARVSPRLLHQAPSIRILAGSGEAAFGLHGLLGVLQLRGQRVVGLQDPWAPAVPWSTPVGENVDCPNERK